MARIARHTFHVDEEGGNWFEQLADQLREEHGGAGPTLALFVLRAAFEELQPSKEWIWKNANRARNDYRLRKIAILDQKRAERAYRRENKQRGENTKPKKSSHRLRKDVFSSDADFNKQMPPPQDQDQADHPSHAQVTHPTNDIAATTSGTLSQEELDEFAARNERILRGEEKP